MEAEGGVMLLEAEDLKAARRHQELGGEAGADFLRRGHR